MAWETPVFDLLWCDGLASDAELRRLWEGRRGRQAHLVVLLASADDESRLKVLGPQQAWPVRELPRERIVDLLQQARSMAVREAAAFLTGEFQRLEEAVVPGLRVKDLLTPHFLRERLCSPVNQVNQNKLLAAVKDLPRTISSGWRDFFQKLGYQIQTLQRGYLLRYNDMPIAVVSPYRDPALFSRLTANGELPEGMVLADCQKQGALWGILAAGNRFRLFQRQPPVGSSTGQYLEIDAEELKQDHRFYLGLLVPAALREGGWLTGWVREAKDFGEALRKGLEERLIREALPHIACGLGAWLEKGGADLSDREQLHRIEEAALTLVFRFMFLLHTEARGYLPISAASYRPHSARKLAEDCQVAVATLSRRSTQRWDRLRTLVRMVRTGDPSVGVPAYNGSLFAADGFPGSTLLEQAEIADVHLAPALTAIAHDTSRPHASGLDYAGLQIGHLGAIYEKLLSLRLTRATEDLAYDTKRDIFRPIRVGEQPEVTNTQLYYQAQAGGRKASGVFYTRHEFVSHLLNHSLAPALDAHLSEVQRLMAREPDEAARRLFDFSVVDPAMGSAHFLTAALDMMADRIEIFLAETGGLPGIRQQLSELTQDTGPATHQPEDGDLLRRLILKRCIFGVDLSPMAVEVANVTLWLASFVPGLALSYLGSNLKCGDALIGVADPSVVGASDSSLLTGKPVQDAMSRAAELQQKQAAIPDRTPEEVQRSEELGAQRKQATARLHDLFSLWTAEPLGLDGARHTLRIHAAAIVSGEEGGEIVNAVDDAQNIAGQYRFFHWPLEFPSIFHRDRAGFDVVVGNPPWNKVKFEKLNFLALHDPGIRGLRSGLERDKRADLLLQRHPELRREIEDTQRIVEEQRRFYRPENGYPIQGRGDTDLYKLFCGRYSSITRHEGFIGVVLPRVAFLNDGSRGFRRWLFKESRPSRIDTLLNNQRWAFDIHPQYSVALLTARVGVPVDGALTVTGPARNEREFAACIACGGVSVGLTALASWTPAPADDSVKEPTWELPLLPTPIHVSVLSKLRRGVRFDLLQPPESQKNRKGSAAEPSLTLYTELHSAQQRSLFTHPPGEGHIPVWKGSSFNQYDPHGRDVAGYASPSVMAEFLERKRSRSRTFQKAFSKEFLNDVNTLPLYQVRSAFRHISNRTNSRTIVACLVPPGIPQTDAVHCIVYFGWDALSQAYALAVMNSVSLDWLSRRYVEANVNYFIFNGLTFPPPDNTSWQRIGALAARLSCIDERFTDFAAKAGVECGPLTDIQREDMRAEIDALVARAYDLTADELRFIFTDFTERAVSPAYRQLVLERFEAL